MSGAHRGALWGEQLSHSLTTQRANAAVRDAAAQAGGYLALLGAYQVALSQAVPDHPLHLARVRKVIQDAGASTTRRSMDLQRVWDLDFDPHAIARELHDTFTAARDQLREQLAGASVQEKWCGFLWQERRYVFCGIKSWRKAEADELLARMRERVETLTLDNDCTAQGLAALVRAEMADV